MILWLVFTLMTAAAVLAVLVPLARRAPEGGGTDIAVYRDQLDEIARDRAAGLIGEQEAEAAKVEVSRRLIAAADAAGTQEKAASAGSPVWRRRWTAIAGLVLVPVSATTLYLMLGSPQLPGEPLQARLRAMHGDHSIESLVVQVEQHLARNPKDARGYAVLAPVYMQLGRFQDAVRARRKVIALSGETAERRADLGEALTAAANGVVTAEAKKSFERALALDAKNYKARFFEGMAAEQDGKTAKAAAIWGAMLKDAPPGARWVSTVRQALAQIGGKAPAAAGTRGPSAAEVAAANKMSPQNRGAFIHSMVARLADRLKQNGDDIAGWQRLLRAYMVLNERAKAHAAAADARRALASDPAKLRQIENTIKSLGLES
ncbi:MAG: c-type cytochrome biogenesis protein CcmI [Pseudolabrys sp.]